MPALDHAESRLENLEAIKPLLGSLRVLSLSTMQMALNRQQSLKEYSERFLQIASFLRAKPRRGKKKTVKDLDLLESNEEAHDYSIEGPKTSKRILAVIGSSRGICGQYNKQLAAHTARLLANGEAENTQVIAFGLRLQNAMRLEEIAFNPGPALSAGSLPDYDSVSRLIRSWEKKLASGEVQNVSLLGFKRLGTRSAYRPKLTQLLPDVNRLGNLDAELQEMWPEPIVEGDPDDILERIEGHLSAIHFYDLILDAISAENLYRYRLLEEAKENTENLVEELSISLQMERRKQITQQMQQLGVASGMLAER